MTKPYMLETKKGCVFCSEKPMGGSVACRACTISVSENKAHRLVAGETVYLCARCCNCTNVQYISQGWLCEPCFEDIGKFWTINEKINKKSST